MNALGRESIRKLILIAVVAVICALPLAGACAGPEGQPVGKPNQTPTAENIDMLLGAQVVLPVQGVTRYVIGAPNVVTGEKCGTGVRLTGTAPGTTLALVYIGAEMHPYQVHVASAIMPDGVTASPPIIVEARATVKPTEEKAANSPEDPKSKAIKLEPGESYLLGGDGITRTSVSIPDVVNIVPVSTREVLVNAIKEGKADVRVWDSTGLATYTFSVVKKAPTPEQVAASIKAQIGIPTVDARVMGDTVVLVGHVETSDLVQKIGAAAEGSGKKVINMVTVPAISAESVVESLKAALPGEPVTYQVLADGTVMMRGTLASEEDSFRIQQIVQTWVGGTQPSGDKTSVATDISFGSTDQVTPPDITDKANTEARSTDPGKVTVSEEYNVTRHVFGGRIANGPKLVAVLEVNPALAKQVMVSAELVEVNKGKLKQLGVEWGDSANGILGGQPFFIVEDGTSPVPISGVGPFRRDTLTAKINALVTQNAAKILSQPKLVIADGHSANILVGGELPIPIAQNNSIGSTSVTVMFKPFGIQLTVRPRISPDGRILLTATPEVSDLDFTNAVKAGGIEIPSLTVRRATTTVHMGNGESLAIGGLLSSKDVKIVRRIPLISQIPIIGELFKSRDFTNNQTELIIILTPTIIENGAKVPIEQPK